MICRNASSALRSVSPTLWHPHQSAWVAHETLVLLIICELVDNAIDALDRVGTIGVAVSELGSVGLVQIVVRDSGQGIPSHIKDRIYSPGVSTKGDGRGFGLSLVAEAVRRLQGKIEYSFDHGAVFCVEIPHNA